MSREMISTCVKNLCTLGVQHTCSRKIGQLLISASHLLANTICTWVGHAGGLLECRRKPSGSKKSNHIISRKRAQQYFQRERMDSLERLRKLASGQEKSSLAEENYQHARRWSEIVSSTCTKMTMATLQSSFLEAARSSDVALQRWYTARTKTISPRIRIATDMAAVDLLRFREQVGSLDGRCCLEA